MSRWAIKDEFIDPALARHVVIFHNPDTGEESQLVHEFKLKSCGHCGHPKVDASNEPVDFHAVKAATLERLNAHHKTIMDYRAKHANVRLVKR